MSNLIEVYQNNTKTISCVISGLSLTGYTPYLTVKSSSSPVALISKTGTVTDASTAVFNLSSIDTSIAAGNYNYDITFIADASIYTVVMDTFSIKNGVKF